MLTRLLKSQRSLAFSFGLVTAVLLLLFLWTLTETVPITVKVQDGLYTAFLGEFSSEIPCPGLEGGEAGLYLTSTSLSKKLWYRPLDLLTPSAAWKKITIAAEGKKGEVLKLYDGREKVRSTAVSWPAPEGKTYSIWARVRRPDGEHAGILFFPPGSNSGWLLQVDSENRQACWPAG